jgi:formate dehydrogenase subunit gamma
MFADYCSAMGGRRVLVGAGLGLVLALAMCLGGFTAEAQQQQPNVRAPGVTIPGGPGAVQAERQGPYDIEMWRKVREGIQGQVSIPDKKAGQLVQSGGEAWRNFRNGPLPLYGAWGLAGIVLVLGGVFPRARPHRYRPRLVRPDARALQ